MPKRPSAMPRTSRGFIIFTLILVMCLSITMGYLATKYIVYPYILKQDLALQNQNSASSGGIVIDENDIPNADKANQGNSQIVEGGLSDDRESPDSNATATDSTQISDTLPTNTEGGFCLQFGNLSTREAADKLVEDLKAGGINSKVAEINGQFKVISNPYSTKDEARTHIPAISVLVPDVFITTAP